LNGRVICVDVEWDSSLNRNSVDNDESLGLTCQYDIEIHQLSGLWAEQIKGILKCAIWGDFELHSLKGYWVAQFEGFWGTKFNGILEFWDAQFNGILGCIIWEGFAVQNLKGFWYQQFEGVLRWTISSDLEVRTLKVVLCTLNTTDSIHSQFHFKPVAFICST
jgi:hypothetical protein